MNPPQIFDFLRVSTIYMAELDIYILETHKVLTTNEVAMRTAFILIHILLFSLYIKIF